MTLMQPPSLWLDDALMMLTLRLEHEVALTRLLRGEGRQEGFLGLFVSDDEAQAIIAELAGTRSVTGAALNDAHIAALWSEVSAKRLATGSIWARYADCLGLTEAELDLLLLALAPKLDPRFGRVYGYLNDDLTKRHLTPGLARVLLDRHGLSVRDVRAMLAPKAPLQVFGLITLTGEVIDVPEDTIDEILSNAPAPMPFFEVSPGNLMSLTGPMALLKDPVFGAAQTAARLMLHEMPKVGGSLAPKLRQAALARARLVVLGADDLGAEAAGDFAREAEGQPICVATSQPDTWAERGLVMQVVDAALPPLAERLECLAPTITHHPADLEPVLNRLRQSGKLDATRLLQVLTRYQDTKNVEGAISRMIDGALDQLASRITTRFTRNDLVLPRATSRALDTVISWRTHAPHVLENWDMGSVFGKSRTLTALFKGPSGTGKTMAASVIANTLGLPLYKVDLATLVSKYIGETERNLDRLFTAAEAADVVLFFDECDAIFGKRSEVSDAHDRYANLETAFLLQRMEQFVGIMILASNLHANMDEAFLRRIDLVAEFPAPGPRERRALWERLRLTEAPLADDVDLEFLSERFDLTGGEIRNCCLDAAHAASVAGGAIGMATLVQAVAREWIKQGRTLHRDNFGVWEAAL